MDELGKAPSPDLDKLFQRLPASIVHDMMRAQGLGQGVLPPTIRPIAEGSRLAGPAFTVSGRAVKDHDAHETLLAWTAMLSRVPAGHVLVMQPNDSIVAHMGELSAEALHLRGVLGAVIDGGCRDVERINAVGLPVFCRYFTPLDVVGCWLPDRFGEAVIIGDCEIATGDVMVADTDGICVVPQAHAEQVAAAAETAMNQENLVRKAILEGIDPETAYRRHGKF
ncbi:RraA family protein [Alterisphingorhabdus coralli]|uniref:RraA family protein n=1 Tax=Alterisphingorhabdus coralli TaxID=3071408 RepID=A0AA97I1Q7_9SPHN|nr:RraA family protein [Parasphingorhabdus sp. SCSIO 66989]WOE75618.1 RraA family protein [Parasphingorhabdus sp. SCSIO 66989]